MNGTIEDVLTILRKQWGELYVTSQATTATLAEMQTHMEQMAAHAERVLTFAIVISSIAFVLTVTAAAVLIYQRTKIGKHKERHIYE